MSVEPIQNPRFNSADTSVGSPGTQDLDRLRRGSGPTGQPASNGHATGLLPRRGAASRHYRLISIGQALSDGACILASLMISHYIRYGDVRPMPYGEFMVVLVAPLLWIVVFRSFNLYAPQHLPQQEEFRRVIGAVSLGIVFLVMVSYWTKSSFPRSWIGMTWLLVLFLELGVRQAWAWRQGRLKRDGRLNFRTLIVGTTREAGRLAEILKAPGSGFAPLGYVRASEPSVSANSLPLLGDLKDLQRLAREHGADCLFVASSSIDAGDMSLVGQVARQEGVEVRVSANLSHTLASRLTLHDVGGAIALSLRPVRLTGTQLAMKRAFDLLVAGGALVISLPVWGLIAAAIRLNSRGPVFFHQERVTKGGRVFRMHKFRTMKVGLDSPVDTSAAFFKLQSDPRLTTVGRLIRRLSLDELPQFWNILVGEMSVVGPRPLPVDQVSANLELLGPRQEVPAGVTGWWQINGRSGVTAEEAVRSDMFYIENWSLSLDLYIVLKTFGAVVSQKGAC